MPFAPSRRVFHDADHLCPMDRRASSRSDASCRRDGVQPEGLIHHRGLRSSDTSGRRSLRRTPFLGPQRHVRYAALTSVARAVQQLCSAWL
jgi:hypothetical protein